MPLYDQKVQKSTFWTQHVLFWTQNYGGAFKKMWPVQPTIIHLSTFSFDILAVMPKKFFKTNVGPKLCYFGPQNEDGAYQKDFHPDGLKKLTNIIYYHPLAHLKFGYFCPYMTKKFKK